MDKENIKKVSQELFEVMDFGEDTVVDVGRWNVIFDDFDEYGKNIGAKAELSILVDEPIENDLPSIPCVVTILFDKTTWKAVSATSENEFGDPNGITNVDLYYSKIEAEKLEKELSESSSLTPKKLKL